jgi:hypothetical protein
VQWTVCRLIMALKHASHGVNKLVGERRGEKIQSGRCRVREVSSRCNSLETGMHRLEYFGVQTSSSVEVWLKRDPQAKSTINTYPCTSRVTKPFWIMPL